MEGSEENYGKKEIVAQPASLTHFDQQVDCTKSGRLPSLSSLREPFFSLVYGRSVGRSLLVVTV